MLFVKVPYFSNQRTVNWPQLGAHALVWIGCYCLITTLYWLSLDARGREFGIPVDWTIARWLGAGHFVCMFIAYYWITRIVYRAIIRERWLHVLLHVVTIYGLTWLATHLLYTKVGESFLSENAQLDSYPKYFKQAGPFYSITSLSIFLPNWWLYSIMLTAIAFKVSREIFHAQNRALRLEINLLRAQINPHFLFNTLNNIYSIVEEKDPYAADILLKFGDIMRYALYETDSSFINLEHEIDMLNEYIELERIRHDASTPARITVDVSGDTGDFVVPPLLLITLVENAFKHGTHATIGSSWVHIRLDVDAQRMQFEVSNSKPPITPKRINKHKLNVHRVGLANIRRRLDLLYPARHKLTIVDTPDTYTITITLMKHGHAHLLPGR
ncbi:sensor histidine kinase [Spirosoma arcticum]